MDKQKAPYGFVYITTCLVNGKKYLGQRVYRGNWQSYIGSGIAFKKAVKKYGRENFIREIIKDCYTADELNEAEKELSIAYDVVENENFYNLVYGGGTSAGWKPSEETRRKISKSNKGNNSAWYGRKHTKEEKEKIGKAHKGKIVSDETRQKIAEKHRGMKATERARQNMSKAQKGKNNGMWGRQQTEKAKTARSKAVVCLETGIKYYSVREAERKTGISRTNIGHMLNGDQKTAGGYHWKYIAG